MKRAGLGLALVTLASACDNAAVELPHDAARPVAPSVAHGSEPAQVEAPRQVVKLDLPALTPTPPADVARTPKRYIKRMIGPHLRGRALAHRVYQARFGPSATTGAPTAVVLARSTGPGTAGRVSGFAHSKNERFDFPPLHDGDALDRVAAVMFHDVDDDPDREVIVLIAYADEDPEAPPYFSNVALDWDAQQGRFVRLDQVEGEIEAFRTAGEVLAHLRHLEAVTPR
ncbi:MAG: hypothetical protein ACE37F_12210 [Nannocystaceae bacterium]|nr:hypothetical protein [bacterium]